MIFVSDQAGNLDLWLKHLSPGLNPPDRPLTFHTASDSSPAISPDGKKIVFVSNRSDAKGDLYLLDLNKIGSKDNPPEPVRLTQDDFMDDDPVWSPDQKNIFFTSHHPETGKETLFRVEVKTGKRYLVLEDGGVDPAVSPGGRRLAYVTGDGLKGLWVFDLVTGKKNRLSKSDTMDVSPRWSADGNKIFFARYQDDTNFDGQLTIDDNPNIWSIEVTGSNPGIERQLTDSSYYDLFPVPASNRRLFFTSNRKKNIDIWEIPAEGLISVRKGYGPVLQEAEGLCSEEPPSYSCLLAYGNLIAEFPGEKGLARIRYRVGKDYLAPGSPAKSPGLFCGYRRKTSIVLFPQRVGSGIHLQKKIRQGFRNQGSGPGKSGPGRFQLRSAAGGDGSQRHPLG
ncbi:MAG: hypothetical protein VX667_08305, partial [Nitrospinota bacterium]|nr:hypothetical protein [Nitrospinota bacterium]